MDTYDLGPVIDRLAEQHDVSYADFHKRLLPGFEGTVLGVRVPMIRKLAAEIGKSDWRGFLEASRSHGIYEIRLMHGIVLGRAKCGIDEKLRLTEAFMPYIDNWAVCDGFCTSFKPRPMEMADLFDYMRACAESDEEYRKRFGLVMLMSYFREEPWLTGVMDIYRAFHHEGYYARMAAAWGLATLWNAARQDCLDILNTGRWDVFTHNKAIQKLCESYRVSEEDKALARTLRRKRED